MENEENEATEEQNLILLDDVEETPMENVDGQVVVSNEITNEPQNLAQNEQFVQPSQQLVDIDSDDIIVIDDEPDTVNVVNEPDTSDEPISLDSTDSTDSQISRKKRKRSSSGEKPIPKTKDDDDDDDATLCVICLSSCELTGIHRVVSLKCGHLFGESCIRRWIRECPQTGKSCPTCKSRSHVKDIRGIYARKICAVDRTEECRLQNLLGIERKKSGELQDTVTKLQIELAIFKDKYTILETQYENARLNGFICNTSSDPSVSFITPKMYRMSLEKNFELNREPGCRTMAYGRRTQTLILSQKSAITLFSGYGVRFLDAYNLNITNNFLHISSKQVRDISLDKDEELLITASLDKGAKLFNISNRAPMSLFTPCDSSVWAVEFDRTRKRYIYTGTQSGNTYLFDIRNPQTYMHEFLTAGDSSPVVSIASVPAFKDIQFGGFLVCKLQSIWFYEYTESQQINPTKLMIEGPFVSMSYNDNTKYILVSTRPTPKYGAARYLVGTLIKYEQTPVFNLISTLNGSNVEKVMIRSTQLKIDNEDLVAAYLQDTTTLATWNTKNAIKMQSLVVKDIIYDMCPMYVNDRVYLAALSDSRCRIYNVNNIT